MRANLVESAAIQGDDAFFRTPEISRQIHANLSKMIVISACRAPLTKAKNSIVILEWLSHTQGYAITMDPNVTMFASSTSNYEIIKWALENHCMLSPHTVRFAVRNGCMKIVKLLYEKCRDQILWDSDILTYAIQKCSIEDIEWLMLQGCPWSVEATEHAVFKGKTALVDLNIKYKKEWSPRLTVAIVKSTYISNLDKGNLLIKCIRHGCPWANGTAAAIVEHCDVATLQLAYEYGCCVRDNGDGMYNAYGLYYGDGLGMFRCMLLAAKKKDKDMMEWLSKHGSPWNLMFIRLIIDTDDLDLLKWAYEREFASMMDRLQMGFFEKSKFAIIQWACEVLKLPWNTVNGSDIGFMINQPFETYKWVVEHGCPVSHVSLSYALRSGYHEVHDWLVLHGYQK
jgi:hypothetical protein